MVIVVRYTESPEGLAALQRAVEEAKFRGALLYVVEALADWPSESPSQADTWMTRLERIRQNGSALECRLREEGVEAHYRLKSDFQEGAADELLAFASDVDADLLVIGVRRRSPVGKLLLGSVSQTVILGAECPVLAVKETEAAIQPG